MMEYHVIFRTSARQEFRILAEDIKNRVKVAVDALRQNPRPPGVRKIIGTENLYRLRVGTHRLVYEVDDQKRIIRVTRVRHRRDAYR
jgi:mRNA interferase RelE/StbE